MQKWNYKKAKRKIQKFAEFFTILRLLSPNKSLHLQTIPDGTCPPRDHPRQKCLYPDFRAFVHASRPGNLNRTKPPMRLVGSGHIDLWSWPECWLLIRTLRRALPLASLFCTSLMCRMSMSPVPGSRGEILPGSTGAKSSSATSCFNWTFDNYFLFFLQTEARFSPFVPSPAF